MAAVRVKGYKQVKTNSLKGVYMALLKKGPLSIAVAASPWHSYGGGIFDACGYDENVDLNHAVVLEGYGEENGVGYWLVRNSWGEEWGEGGYIKMLREEKAHCGWDTTP